MFGYFLSVAVAFIFFGTIFNISKNFTEWFQDFDFEANFWLWVAVLIASFLWFVVVPCFTVLLIVFLLKKLTDKISQFILRKFKK